MLCLNLSHRVLNGKERLYVSLSIYVLVVVSYAYVILIKLLSNFSLRIRVKPSTYLEPLNLKRYKDIVYWNENYCWLINKLSTLEELPLTHLRIPEIVSWEDGAPKFILRYNGKRVIKLDGKNMNKEFVHLNFATEARDSFERKAYRYQNTMRKEIAHQLKGSDYHSSYGIILKDEKHRAVLRLRDEANQTDSGIRLISDKVFNEIITKWNTSELKKILLMQEFVKLRTTTPYAIVIQFFASLHEYDKNANIDYTQSSFTTTEANSELEVRIKTCKELCRLICYHLSEKAKIEILEMRVEFLTSRTECWLNNATNVIWREKKFFDSGLSDEAFEAANRARMARIFERIQSNEELKKNTNNTKSLEGLIWNHIESMKDNMGLAKLMLADPKDPTTDIVFKALKPECPYKYTEMMDPSPIIYKSMCLSI